MNLDLRQARPPQRREISVSVKRICGGENQSAEWLVVAVDLTNLDSQRIVLFRNFASSDLALAFAADVLANAQVENADGHSSSVTLTRGPNAQVDFASQPHAKRTQLPR